MKYLAALAILAVAALVWILRTEPEDEPLPAIFADWPDEDTYVAALARRLAA